MSINSSLKSGIKKLRSSQPFNRIATSGSRSLLSVAGLKSEFLIKHLHRIDLVETKLPNGKILRLQSKGDDWVSNQVFWRGWQGYEPETIPLFFRLAQTARVTFDIGSYVCFFTLLAAHANTDGKIYAFEPLSAIYERLQQNIELNNLRNVESVLGAVGAEEGEAEFFHLEGAELPTSSSLSQKFVEDVPNVTATKVKIFKLDKFAAENNIERIDLMKIDTESTEPDVLRGARSILERDHPQMICEVLKDRGSEKPLAEILRPLGYKFYLMTPDGLQQRHQIEGHPEFLNYFFTTLEPGEASKL